jgi:hypothetical protein
MGPRSFRTTTARRKVRPKGKASLDLADGGRLDRLATSRSCPPSDGRLSSKLVGLLGYFGRLPVNGGKEWYEVAGVELKNLGPFEPVAAHDARGSEPKFPTGSSTRNEQDRARRSLESAAPVNTFNYEASQWSLVDAAAWIGCRGLELTSQEIADRDLEEKGGYELFAALMTEQSFVATGINRKRVREPIPAEYWRWQRWIPPRLTRSTTLASSMRS